MSHRYPLYTLQDTQQIAAQFAQTAQIGDVFLLQGDLGAGKSTFSRFFIQALCGKNTVVPSPTFTLLQTYDSPKGTIYHYDFYRIDDPEEAYELGIEESFYNGICLIEWPEKITSIPIPNARILRISLEDGVRKLEAL